MAFTSDELRGEQEKIDQEHRMLATLLMDAGSICTHSAESTGNCGECTPEVRQTCADALSGVGRRLMTLMLGHFQREETLMPALPNTQAVRAHCEGHRASHANFVRLYNDAVRRMDACDVAASAQRLEKVVTQWARDHAMTFDEELSHLIGECYVRVE